MIIEVKLKFDEAEKALLKGLGLLKEKEQEGIFPEPLTAEEMVKELKKVAKEEPAEEVPFEAEASEEKPKKAKAAKSTPKEEKPAPEAPVSSEREVTADMVRAILFDLRQMGKKAEVKKLFDEFGVSKLSEIKEEQYEAVFDAAAAIKNAG